MNEPVFTGAIFLSPIPIIRLNWRATGLSSWKWFQPGQNSCALGASRGGFARRRSFVLPGKPLLQHSRGPRRAVKRYWDSSALLNAFWDSRIEKLSQEPDQWTRSHTKAEMFSTLTGGRLGAQFYPSDTAEIVRELTLGMNFVELSADEIQTALDKQRTAVSAVDGSMTTCTQ